MTAPRRPSDEAPRTLLGMATELSPQLSFQAPRSTLRPRVAWSERHGRKKQQADRNPSQRGDPGVRGH